jgi:hypothetical protein
VQTIQNVRERGRDDALADQCVEELRTVPAGSHDRGEIASWVEAAVHLGTRRAQRRRGALDRGQRQRLGALLGNDRVEHQPRHGVRIGERVALGDERPVGDAVDRQARDPERAPELFDVRDRLRGREVAPVGSDRTGAGTDHTRRRHDQVRRTGGGL